MIAAFTGSLVGTIRNRWRFFVLAALFITHHSLLITASAQTIYGDVSYTKQTLFRIPVTTEPNQRLKQIQLWYSIDQGQNWHPYPDSVTTQQLHPGTGGRSHLLEGHFDFQANKDGVYWFTTRIVDVDGRGNPLTMENARAGLRVCVDTQAPVPNLRPLPPRDGEVGVAWDVRDDNLDPASLRLEYRLPGGGEWLAFNGDVPVAGQHYWRPNTQGTIEVRLRARDRADNWGEEKTQVALGGVVSGGVVSSAQPADSNLPFTGQSPANRYLVNSKRISLNYELKDLGPSRVSLVELWITRDGRNWQKYKEETNLQFKEDTSSLASLIVEVNDEGLYGFTLVARSGVGLGERPPQVGDPPQVWVEVDLTKPVVKTLNVEPPRTPDDRNLTITWSAIDKNFGPKPITLFYIEARANAGEQPAPADGSWTIIADHLENTGRYVWTMPPSVPFRMYFKVEATDRAGNVGGDKTANPVLVDLSKPKVTITNVGSSNP
jgi:hypothetical protein